MTTFRKILLATVAAFAVTVTYGRTITPYEYLTISGAGQNGFHVLTDIVPKSNTVVRAKYSSSSNAKTGHNQLLFCSRTDYNTSDLFQFAPNVGGKFSFGYYNKTFPSDDTFEPGNVYEVCVRDGVAQIKDAATEDVVAELGTGTEDFSPRYRLALFQSYSYNNGYVSWSNSFHGNFYYLKIYDIEGGEEVLKHHFIACLEDGVVKVCDLADSYRTYALTKNGSGTSSVNIGGSADAPVSFVAWTGNDSANPTDWFSPDNWDGYAVPGMGDNVSVGTGASVIISNSTPALASISVSGTLMFTNWATCLSATTVTIPSGGILTCAGPFTDTAMSNRVWIACTDLTIATGGSIDVSNKGFASAKGPGKGFSSNQVAGGGAHGGYGSTLNHATAVNSSFANAAYDSASEPILPGSGGNSHPGGGAIRIDALGVVTLNGDLLANGQNAGNSDSRTGGAGGSILVNCSRIIAAPGARIYAEGGNLAGANYPVKNVRLAGAGGRIAIHYDPSAQTAADMAGAFVSAAAGYDMYVYNTSTRRYPASRYSLAWCNAAQDGTLWLQDEKAFGTGLAYLGTHFAGRLVNVSSLSVDGDLAVTNRLGFANAGVALTVSGNLSVVGHFGKFVFGETELSTTRARKRSAGSLPVSLVVGGDFSLSDGGRADIHAGATNGTDVAGAVISVGGAFTVGDDSTVYLYSHPENGGAPFITAASCSIDEGALVSADTFGFESANDVKNSGFGPGFGNSSSSGVGIGASHGGCGGGADASKTYGSAIYPVLPGTSGGTGGVLANNIPYTLAGGGVVHIKVRGAFALNGTVSANGILQANHNASSPTQYEFGGGSGGSILLEGKTFSGGATAILSANGGGRDSPSARSGGGGRISIIVGNEYRPDVKASNLIVEDSLPAAAFLGSATVSTGAVGDGTYSIAGDSGTIRFVTVKSGQGLAIFVR